MRLQVLLVAVLFIPLVVAQTPGTIEVGPNNVERHVSIPVLLTTGGIGSSLFEGHIDLYVNYDQLVSDDDAEGSDNFTANVELSIYAPGSDFADFDFNATVIESDCEVRFDHVSRNTDTYLSYYSAVIQLHNNGTNNGERCNAHILVENLGSDAFEKWISVTVWNNDGDPNHLQNIALLAFIIWTIDFVLVLRIRHAGMRTLAAFVGYGILLLPLSPDQQSLFLLGQSLVFLYTCFRL